MYKYAEAIPFGALPSSTLRSFTFEDISNANRVTLSSVYVWLAIFEMYLSMVITGAVIEPSSMTRFL